MVWLISEDKRLKFDTRAIENLIRIAKMVNDFGELQHACALAEKELERNLAAWETVQLIHKVKEAQ